MNSQRDALLLALPVMVALACFWLAREHVELRWLLPAVFAVNFIGHLAVKTFVPEHAIWRRIPLLATIVIAVVITGLVAFVTTAGVGFWLAVPVIIITLLVLSALSLLLRDDNEDDAAGASD